MDKLIKGVSLTPLKIIRVEEGDVMHALKSTDDSFAGFGEAYFSTIKKGSVKGWKFHTRMTLSVVVPVGGIRFVIYDDKTNSETYDVFNEFFLGPNFEYVRLTVPPNLWTAFQGVEDTLNVLLNLANIPHDPTEAKNLPINNDYLPKFDWR